MIVAIHPNDVDEFWPIIKPFFEKALTRGTNEFDVDDLYFDLKDGDLLLLMVRIDGKWVGCVTAKIMVYPLKRVFTILTASGEQVDSWVIDIFETLEKIAREYQADTIQLHGRRGWLRKLHTCGMRELYTTAEKVL